MRIIHMLINMLVLVFLVAGCAQVRQVVKAPLSNEGELFLYTEPFPQDAIRLEFTVGSIVAVREDGLQVPLALRFRNFSPAEAGRQRLFASGVLPPGNYRTLAVTVKEASLMGEEGKGRLLVPEKPHEVRAVFTIRSGKATVVSLDLNYRNSLAGRVSFHPEFIVRIPSQPLLELSGYVTNRDDNTITVFDRHSALVGGMIATGRGPTGMVLDPLRQMGYVALSGEDAVAVLDLKENDFIDRIRLLAGDEPHFMALTPDGRLAITANKGSNTASIIDIPSRSEVARVQVGNSPEYVLIDRSGRRAFIFNRQSASISIIDLDKMLVSATLTTESAPVFGQFNRKGDSLYVFHELSPYLLMYSLDSLTIARRIDTGPGTGALKLDPSTDKLYVGSRYGGVINVYNPFSLMAVEFLFVKEAVGYMTIDGEENNLLALLPDNRLLKLVNLVSRRERGMVDTGSNPYCAVVFRER